MAESHVHLAGNHTLVSNVWLDEREGAVASLRASNGLRSLMGPIDVARSLDVTLPRESCVRGAGSRDFSRLLNVTVLSGEVVMLHARGTVLLLQKHSLSRDLAVIVLFG